MNGNDAWYDETISRATAISDAYKSTLGRLWWANLMFVVVPAVLTTAAAIFAALPQASQGPVLFGLPAASISAGVAAILTTIHKALKCDDYQAECLRLSQAYQSIAIDAQSASSTATPEPTQARLTRELVDLTKNAQAQVRTSFMKGPDGTSAARPAAG